MSTHAIIARRTGVGKYEGRYHHSDGYPTHLGRVLFSLYRTVFKSNALSMVSFLLDEHPAGWSFLGLPTEAGGVIDYDMKPGYVADHESLYEKDSSGKADWSKPIHHGPRCYCHGDRHEAAQLETEASAAEWNWAYVIDPGARVMRVLQYGAEVAEINLDGQEPEWEFIECGNKLERCSHYAWKHFPELRGTSMDRLVTAKFLGSELLGLQDAHAVEIGGVRYSVQGSGSMATLQRTGKQVWVALLEPPQGFPALHATGAKAFRFYHGGGPKVYEDGRFYYPIFGYGKAKAGETAPHVQLQGIKPIYPPTLKQPLEVFAAIRATTPQPQDETAHETQGPLLRFFRDED